MMKRTFVTVMLSMCVFALSAAASYTVKYTAVYDDEVIAIATLESELQSLHADMQTLENEKELMPIERNWLTVQGIIDQYPDLIWRSDESLGISTETENAWGAMMIASPDLVLPVMRRIQRTVPAEVLEVQLDRQQGVLLMNILGVAK